MVLWGDQLQKLFDQITFITVVRFASPFFIWWLISIAERYERAVQLKFPFPYVYFQVTDQKTGQTQQEIPFTFPSPAEEISKLNMSRESTSCTSNVSHVCDRDTTNETMADSLNIDLAVLGQGKNKDEKLEGWISFVNSWKNEADDLLERAEDAGNLEYSALLVSDSGQVFLRYQTGRVEKLEEKIDIFVANPKNDRLIQWLIHPRREKNDYVLTVTFFSTELFTVMYGAPERVQILHLIIFLLFFLWILCLIGPWIMTAIELHLERRQIYQMLQTTTTNCAICLDPLSGQIVRLEGRQCTNHIFHARCLKSWSNKVEEEEDDPGLQQCPLCRQCSYNLIRLIAPEVPEDSTD